MPGRKPVIDVDLMGGVFTPVPGKTQRPVYTYGPAGKSGQRTMFMFQCPVSAIPRYVFDLLDLWWACSLNRSLPLAGGFLDQPESVQVAFPLFGSMLRMVERQSNNPQMAAALAVGAMMKMLTGGGRS